MTTACDAATLPSVTAASITNPSGSSIDLSAHINPEGSATTYRFEYGTTSAYGATVPIPDEQIGTGSASVVVVQHIKGLSQNVTYHWRIVASNESGTILSNDHTFIFDTTGEGLPDGRAYEMVTPPQKDAALIGPAFGPVPLVSESGSQLIVSSIQCFAKAESCTGERGAIGEPFLFSRTSRGWLTTALAPPATRFESSSYWLANAEDETALFSMPTSPMFEDDFYARLPGGSFTDIGPATQPSGGAQGDPWSRGPVAGTADLSRIVYRENMAYWPLGAADRETLYEFSGFGKVAPTLVGVGPNNSLISRCETYLGGSSNRESPGSISANGETVFFTAARCEAGANGGIAVPANEVFARVGGEHTVPVSEPSAFSQTAPYGGCVTEACIKNVNEPGNWSDASFAGASSDGAKAFFLSSQQLLDEASQGSPNLYEYDFNAPPTERLIDVSGREISGRGPGVEGVVALGPDGSHVYFIATGVLTDAGNSMGESARYGANNLYVFARDSSHPEGYVAFIARLPESDRAQWESNDQAGEANVTPDGRFLVFESHGDLTPDTTQVHMGDTQIFRYDAQQAELIRISIGERGFNDNGNDGIGNAQIVPAFYGGERLGAPRSDPTMSHDGAFIFFQSPVGLTVHALDDIAIGTWEGQATYAENIYEWHEGQVHLISDGRDTGSALLKACGALETFSSVCLVGSDATGRDVFFTTANALTPEDVDTQVDYYDARICTATDSCIAPQAPTLPPCIGEACHGIPRAAIAEPLGSTATLNSQSGISLSHIDRATRQPGKKRDQRCRSGRRHRLRECRRLKGRNQQASGTKFRRGHR